MYIKRCFFALLIAASVISCTNEKLPYYGERETRETKKEDGTIVTDTIYKTISDFKFLNQDSVIITQSNLDGKVYIADFFFTSCTTICPEMHRNMKTVYDLYKDNDNVLFVSHTIDFKYDKPSVLKNYSKKLGVDNSKWQFLYGSKEQVYKLAEKDYLVAVNEDSTARDGYIHQGYLVLIDKGRHIRGAYDGTDKAQVEQLKKDLAILLKEEN
ncbi:MAG: SCO family protein [Pedobacter sp.]|nr:MAG: SCO family protein [Pedobacter sp.]